MSSAEERKDHDMHCEKAVALIIDLCLDDSPLLQPNTCQDFITLLAPNPNSAWSGMLHSPTASLWSPLFVCVVNDWGHMMC